MKLKVCVVTGTRAEYGLLRPLLDKMKSDSEIDLQLVVTGMHLSKKFGNTYSEIEDDGFEISQKIPILSDSNEALSIAYSVGTAVSKFAKSFDFLKPNILVVLGDRFEIFAAAIAAHLSKLPIAHIQGGESTEGLMDEAFRHSITKMSHLHFVSTIKYQKRIIQLGENPNSVIMVGALGVENALNTKLIQRAKLQEKLKLEFSEKNVLVTFHPVTLDEKSSGIQFSELLSALDELEDTTLIFTLPNVDTGSHEIIKMIEKFISSGIRRYAFPSLGVVNYLSCMKLVDVVIGNSSSGLIEAPSLKKPSINIGDRQRGRVRADSVIDCRPNYLEIKKALDKATSPEFLNVVESCKNPYEFPGTSDSILRTIKKVDVTNILKKYFYDLDVL